MTEAAIWRSLGAVLLAAAANAQTIGAGARAVVGSDTLPVYTAMSTSGPPKLTLKRGDHVVIGLVIFDNETTWCAVSNPGETRRLGWASCEFLEPDRGPVTTPTPVATPTPTPIVTPTPLPAPTPTP